jgi:hypothetical protein
MWLESISPFYYTKHVCEDNLHDLMVLNCLNIILTSITMCVILFKSPIRVVDNRVDLK